MSQYLQIRKNNVELFDFCRSAPIVQAIEPPYNEEWVEMPKSFSQVIEEIRRRIKEYEQRIDSYKIALKATSLSLDDVLEIIDMINSTKDEIEEQKYTLVQIQFIQQMIEDGQYYYTDEDEKDPNRWEWRYC